ncbi:MAG TPA: CRISPR system precrRNA processing endoribonuclease RAMP protein Cas6, partial [Pirellulales bacterium]
NSLGQAEGILRRVHGGLPDVSQFCNQGDKMNQQSVNYSVSALAAQNASTSCLSPASFLSHILILPRRLWLDTPGVAATVPMLRGTWGAALHDLDREAYANVFGSDEESGGNTTPGYLMRPAPPDPHCAPAIDFFLFGQALEYDEACRHAWHEAARRGLGPKRQAFQIRGTFLLGPNGTLREERSTRPHPGPLPPGEGERSGTARSPFPTQAQPPIPNSQPLAWPLSQAVWPLDPNAPCRLVFNAPLRLRRRGCLIEQPTLADIVVAGCRRIEAFLPEPLRDDWKCYSAAALEAARNRPPAAWDGVRLDLHRWSARQKNELDLHGVTGSLALAEGPGELAPLLAAAQWLHLGKGTVMGLGQFEVEDEG